MKTSEDLYEKNRKLTGFEQSKLTKASVLIIGAGGLGSPAAYYLASSGVGTLGIVDFDKVSVSNLQRQILHSTESLGKLKTESAQKTLNNLNPFINIKAYNVKLDKQAALELFPCYDIVLDCTDNFETKFLINDSCVELNKPLVHAGITEYEGQIMTILPYKTACYRCVFKEAPSIGNYHLKKGIFAPTAGIIGSLQASEVLKLITGIGDPLYNQLLTYKAHTQTFRKIPVNKDSSCSSCVH